MRLIRMRFPKLIPNIAATVTPVELAAILARREAEAETGLPPEEIGVFSIVPCSSQVTAAHSPEGLQKPVLDGAFAIRDIYLRLLGPMKDLQKVKPLSSAGIMGVGWAFCGGESAARLGERYLAVDGIEKLYPHAGGDRGRSPAGGGFHRAVRLHPGAAWGGCLTVENPYGARMRIKRLMKGLPVSRSRYDFQGRDRDLVKIDQELQYVPAFRLDQDRSVALEKLLKIDELERSLPGLDCGSCSAPPVTPWPRTWCWGGASMEDCIFKVRSACSTWRAAAMPTNICPPLPAAALRRPPRRGEKNQREVPRFECKRAGPCDGLDRIYHARARPGGERGLCGRPSVLGDGQGPRRATPGSLSCPIRTWPPWR